MRPRRRIVLLFALSLATSARAVTLTGAGSVIGAGDVDGDGYDDLFVGDPGFDGPETDEGAAFLFLGSADGIDATTAAARFESDRAHAGLGKTLAAGDFDGDGLSDIAIGIPDYTDVPQLSGGAVLVFRGRQVPQNGTPATADAMIRTDLDGWITGVASAGDVNGDGYDDLVAIGPTDLFLFHGSASGIPSGARGERAPRGHLWRRFGETLHRARRRERRRLRRPSAPRISQRSPLHQREGLSAPRQRVRIATGLVEDADTVFSSDTFVGDPGPDVAIGMGDVNGDGFDDVVIAGPESGVARSIAVYFGSAEGIPSGTPDAADARLTEGPPPHFYSLGTTLAVLDSDGDGYADIATDVTVAMVGPVDFLWRDGPGGPPSGAVDPSAMPSIPFVGTPAGDLNRDGYADMASASGTIDVVYGPAPGAALGAGIACAALAGLRRRAA